MVKLGHETCLAPRSFRLFHLQNIMIQMFSKIFAIFLGSHHFRKTCLLPSLSPLPIPHFVLCLNGITRAVHSGGQGGGWQLPRPGKVTVFFKQCLIWLSYFLWAILVRNLYMGDPCGGVRGLPPQTKNPRYDPDCITLLLLHLILWALVHCPPPPPPNPFP